MMNPSLRRQPLMRGARAAVAVAALCFTVPLAMLAQSGSASFEGTVVDSSGAPWSGAQVTLSPVGMDQLKARLAAEQDKAEALKQEFEDQDVLESFKRQMEALTAQTDEAGRFLIGDVPPGDYSVRVRKPGFVELEETVSLAASQRVRRDFSMTIGSIEETVNVSTGDAVPVPTSADRETLERLRARLSGGRLQPPVKVRSLNPAYPEDLRGSGAEGQVILETLVSAGGSVEVLNVLTPVDPDLLTPVQPELARAAVTAVRQWQYQATRLNDLPVDTRMTVTINFTDES